MNIVNDIMPFRPLETRKADEKSTRDLLASPVIQSRLYLFQFLFAVLLDPVTCAGKAWNNVIYCSSELFREMSHLASDLLLE